MENEEIKASPLERRAAALVERIGADYINYQYAFVDFFVDHLTDLSRSYGGDFQQIMVLAIIGQRRLHATLGTGGTKTPEEGSMAISASRLAGITGIPRETVRRKLAQMQAKGWLVQGPDGAWSLAADEDGQDFQVRRDHAEFEQRARRRVARFLAAIEGLGSRQAD